MQISEGLKPEHAAQAAALYWEAFGGKLGKLMGPGERARAFFADTVNTRAVISATDGGTLLGIAAFKAGGQGFSSSGLADLWRHYGMSALWRVVPLAMLERNAPDGVLQMDGICVAAAARGQGVGSALFDALFAMAQREGFDAVTLDVIDTNPRAKALYERLGFETTGTESASVLRGVLGFDYATRMVRKL
ncbi:GNAT family N-acetyltransferase [Pacificoceanicola onchidii]|uniref:GNAT family N-acetyltransferase n=1 Tax=Pacificoceanicola onchidii TaxID=2562685 RepID=UPI0010A5C5F3|nr:GNAT family N-acetyltransferase [Pacificoceanicola onchidii]